MLLSKSLSQLSQLLQLKQVSAVDLITEAFAQIEQHDGKLKNFITTLDKDQAIAAAKIADKSRSKDSNPLLGIPFSVKDAYVTRNLRTTSGSKVLDDFTPPYSATVVEKLEKAGAILIGKNTQDAWGHGGSSENTDYGVPANPWSLDHIAGGSSGGVAGAVAARMVGFAIGEDTGGSIRNPASMCSVTGLKVTYGRVSRYGSIAYASSLDTVGPMAKSVEDVSIILSQISGRDHHDASSSSKPVPDYQSLLSLGKKRYKIGLPIEFFTDVLNAEVGSVIKQAASLLESQGFELVEISIPSLSHAISIYYLLALSETSSNLARYDGIRFGYDRSSFTTETVRRIMVGTYALSAGYASKLYKNAQKARTVMIQEYYKAFAQCDLILAPVTPNLPAQKGSLISNPMANILEDLYTVTVNVVGAPSLAMPAGFSRDNLPIGMQLIGKKFEEATILQVGHFYQQLTDWHSRIPTTIKEKK